MSRRVVLCPDEGSSAGRVSLYDEWTSLQRNQTREDEFQVYRGLKGAKRVTRFYDLVAANKESMKGR